MTDRRSKRSMDPLVALHYQLATAREASRCDVLVLAEPSGLVVAGAGSWAACEELAAYAPLLARSEPGDDFSRRMSTMREHVDVTRVHIDGQEMLLAARGGDARREVMDRAAVGVTRILRAAA